MNCLFRVLEKELLRIGVITDAKELRNNTACYVRDNMDDTTVCLLREGIGIADDQRDSMTAEEYVTALSKDLQPDEMKSSALTQILECNFQLLTRMGESGNFEVSTYIQNRLNPNCVTFYLIYNKRDHYDSVRFISGPIPNPNPYPNPNPTPTPTPKPTSSSKASSKSAPKPSSTLSLFSSEFQHKQMKHRKTPRLNPNPKPNYDPNPNPNTDVVPSSK
jgi:hypothetical protein